MYNTDEVFEGYLTPHYRVPYPVDVTELVEEHEGDIGGCIPVSFSDYTKPAAVIFVNGCPYNCPHCHNKEVVESKAGLGEPFLKTFQRITHRCACAEHAGLEVSPFIQHVVISGGEPTAYTKLPELIRLYKYMGMGVKVDTMGFNVDVMLDHLDIVDAFYIDVKGPWEMYPELVGIPSLSVEKVKQSFSRIFDAATHHPEKFVFRTTMVPELSESDIEQVKQNIPVTHSLKLQKFRSVTSG